MQKEHNCIFCKIVAEEIPCHKVYGDSEFLAFLDIHPLNQGHTLIIPKKHYRWVWDVDNISEYFSVVKKIANALKKSLKTDLIISFVVGEEVPHAHVSLIPRFKNDGHGAVLNFKNIKKFSDDEMKEIAENIRKNL